MNIKWNTITWYSKLLAIIFFIGILPAWTFYVGMKYQKSKEEVTMVNPQGVRDISTSKQKDEVVFLHRDNDVLSLYVINADGSNKRLVYRNSDSVNSNIIAAKWSGDNTILFGAMRGGDWKVFSIKSDGTDLMLVSDLEFDTDFAVSQDSRDKDIIVEDVFAENEYRLSYIESGVNKKIYSVSYSKCEPSCPMGGLIHEASFSPNKKYVIFDQGKDIMIVSTDGKEVRVLTEGERADWH